jgi:hypothetical protein
VPPIFPQRGIAEFLGIGHAAISRDCQKWNSQIEQFTKEDLMSDTVQNKDFIQQDVTPANQASVPLQAEELEAVIAPRLATNHNEHVLAARLEAEELEAVIVPRLATNHNETVLG